MVMQQDELVLQRQAAAEPQAAGGAGGQEQPPAALLARAEQMQAATNDVLQGRLDHWASVAAPVHSEAAAHAPLSEAGTPITDYGYVYWDCLMYGPFQFPGISELPVRPNKIIRANEWTLLSALVWINPAFHLGNLPATQIAGGRTYRAKFELFNFSDVTNGPDQVIPGVFPGPAPQFNWFNFWYRYPDPGQDPDLYEAVFTIDLQNSGIDMAAFATWHLDPDAELPFGPYAPRWRHDMPARFLVYRF
jgi:hypothetical protein